MGSYTLIPDFSWRNLNKAEKVNFIVRYISLIPRKAESSDPEYPSVQSDDEYNFDAINLKQEQLDRLEELSLTLQGLTMQTRASAETAEMQEVDTDRTRIAQYIVSRTLNWSVLPLATEREAAKHLAVELSPYEGIYNYPTGQKSAIIMGLLQDARKEEYAEDISTLAISSLLDELEVLNNKYQQLAAQRTARRNMKSEKVTADDTAAEAKELIDDINAQANATNILEPNDDASSFIREVIKLVEDMRTARNMRGSRDEDEDSDGGEDTDKPSDDDGPVVQ